MASHRTIITLSEQDRIWLETYSQAIGISKAEVIRRGLAQLKAQEEGRTYKKIVEQSRGCWSKGDGLSYQRRIRSEW